MLLKLVLAAKNQGNWFALLCLIGKINSLQLPFLSYLGSLAYLSNDTQQLAFPI
jgi:hypothetical protein